MAGREGRTMITFTYRIFPTGRLVWGSGIPRRREHHITLDYFHRDRLVNTLSSLEEMGEPVIMIGRFNYSGSLSFHGDMKDRKG